MTSRAHEDAHLLRSGVTIAFLSFLDEPQRQALCENNHILDIIDGKLGNASSTWPDISIPSECWGKYAADRLPEHLELDGVLDTWATDDLYLCCACVFGNATALKQFEQQYGPVIVGALRKRRLSEALVEEVTQALYVNLLVGEEGRKPGLHGFRGSGRLASWLRIVTARTGRRILEKEKKYIPTEDPFLDEQILGEQRSPDLWHMKQSYRDTFRRAFKKALSELPTRQQNLIGHYYLDQLTTREIATIYRVNHTTVVRWLSQLRDHVLADTRTHLRHDLSINADDCDSLLRLIESQFDITLSTFFRLHRLRTDNITDG